MPRIFDNIDQHLLGALQETLQVSDRADFCVGYFNLRGWKRLDEYIERWSGGEGHCCRLLVGMQRLPEEELRAGLGLAKGDAGIDNKTAAELKAKLAQAFRDQLAVGAPSNEDERGLRRLSAQIKARKVVVKLFLRHPLHAKLYLLFRPDPINPTVGYLGSSNLTLAGLSQQGELNVDVMDRDACDKLARWFDARWNEHWCVDISDELARIIDESWAREELIPPYHIYLKMAYHLSAEARTGLAEFQIPRDLRGKLLPFQSAAVRIAAHHLNRRGGVLIGDVVGLGKTRMAATAARILEETGLETLIICPRNLVPMWEDYRIEYDLRARVLSASRVMQELPDLRRFRIVIVDESHNLRNREGKRFRAIQEYIAENESKVILLSATPYNKTYADLSSQLRLFVPEEQDLGIRPERLLRELGETEFIRRHQCPVRSLAAFEKSEHTDDWRDLMRLYLVRRTRTFIKENYAHTDPENGRQFLVLEDGSRSYFPDRVPKRVPFIVDDADPSDQYGRLYAPVVVDTINDLNLPRYGLGNYVEPSPHGPPTQNEAKALADLSRAGKRLMGFCRTNLFKRLESSGQAFVQSVERHILRNFIFLHAIEHGLELPIGTQDAGLLDPGREDEDLAMRSMFDDNEADEDAEVESVALRSEDDFRRRAAQIYQSEYVARYRSRFKWLRPTLFIAQLAKDLWEDAQALLDLLQQCGEWDASGDAKLNALERLLVKKHQGEKVVVFTQFADTVRYLTEQLQERGVTQLAGVTGDTPNPTEVAWRFSPEANERPHPEDELRVLVATDILSEGLNLHDGYIVVNFDLPWALIRLTQRVGRVDRIGQKAEKILCYSFLPAEGVERIIGLRGRLRNRVRENAEVVGTDEAFFEDDDDRTVVSLYHEKAGLLDDPEDTEVDLGSRAYQIWHNAISADPKLEKVVSGLPPVVYSARSHAGTESAPPGVLVYLRTADDNDALVWMDEQGDSVSESPLEILKAAECRPDTPAVPRAESHHGLVRKGVELVVSEERSVGGQLGRPSGARFRTYERLRNHAERVKGTIWERPELLRAIQDIYEHPLRSSATDTLNRQLRSGISDEALADLVIGLRDEGRLCVSEKEQEANEPQIICSLGLVSLPGGT